MIQFDLEWSRRHINQLLHRTWNSPTVMTWGSFFMRSVSFLLVLPLVLIKLPAGEIVIWYLFGTVFAMQGLLDIGFGSTFSRAISYAMGGATSVRGLRGKDTQFGNGRPNWSLLARVVSSMRMVYLWLALGAIVIIGVFGTWALVKPITSVLVPERAWLAWGVLLAIYPFAMWGNIYTIYLEGANHVALVRYWDIFMSIGSIGSLFMVLSFGGGLFELVITNQIWVVVRVLKNRALCGRVEDGQYKTFIKVGIDKEIFVSLWPSTWRSSIGGFMSYGLVYTSNLLVAQLGNTAETASYLLALKLIDAVSQVSQSPFYSKLPLMVRKRAMGDISGLVRIAARGMVMAYWTYVAGFVFLGLFSGLLLRSIRSHALFVAPELWALIGLAFFIHRYGAMHIQLYSTTNQIIWHVADTASGVIIIFVTSLLFKYIGVYAMPVGWISGYLGFYSWFSARNSYREIQSSFFHFERLVFIPPLVVMLVCFVVAMFSGVLV